MIENEGMFGELTLDRNAALIIIDLQKAIDHPSWGERNNPDAERNVARLLSRWRRTGQPLFHIRHDSAEPNSTYRPGQAGHDFKPETAPLDGEAVIAKQVHSAFCGTPLQQRLLAMHATQIVVAGVITNNSVEATVRHANNLGFDVILAEDACFTFGRTDWRGNWRTAQEVHDLSLANMSGEYCRIVTTEQLLNSSSQETHQI